MGTANDTNLARYRLEAALVDENTFVTFATGTTPVNNAVLGTLDPSVFKNGVYRVRLVGEDTDGQRSTTEITYQLTGEKKPGNFSITFPDLKVPVSGIDISVNRTYTSLDRARALDFGYGWTLEIGKVGKYANNRKPGDGWTITSGRFGLPCQTVNEPKKHVTEIRFSDTEFYRFKTQLASAGAISGGCMANVSFAQIGGVPGATLTPLGNAEAFCQNGVDQCLDLDTFETYQPAAVRLRTASGIEYDLQLGSGLTAVREPNGNSLTISRTGVTHSSGKSITITRDSQNRVTRITDPLGKSIGYTYNAAGDLVAVTDRAGNTTTFAYDGQHYLGNITDPLGNVPLRNEYDANGRLIAQIDAAGNRTEYTIDLANNKTTVQDREGIDTTLTYNDDGLITSAASGGAELKFSYDANGNKLTETDQLGKTRSFSYDAASNLLSETDPLGNKVQYAYNSTGRLTSLADPNGKATTFSYDAKGNVTQTKDATGAVTAAYTYDLSGNPTQVTSLGGTANFSYNTFGKVTRQQGPGTLDRSFTYDANGNLLSETSKRTVGGTPVSETTTYTYDANGRVLSMTDPRGFVSRFTYNAAGLRLTETDARGNTASFTYDVRGNLIKKTFADGTFESYGYDAENRKTALTDQAGRTTFFEYDGQGRPTRTVYADGTAVSSSYDAKGNLISATDERNNSTQVEYNANGLRTRMVNPVGSATLFTYNANRAMTASTDPLGYVTQFAYDENTFGVARPLRTTFADGSTVQRTYDVSGRLASETNEANQTSSYSYNQQGKLVKVTDAIGGNTAYGYDEAGNRTSQTDANGNTTTFEYDAGGRMTKRTLPDGLFETFSYDGMGNKVSHTDLSGQTSTYEYNRLNRLVKANLADGSIVSYTYTPLGLPATVADARGVTRYTYDARNRPTKIENPDGTVLSYSYDATGNRTAVTSIAGTTRYTYDAANRLATVTDPQGGITRYSYDAAGNRTAVGYPNGTETRYPYDVRSRLTGVEHRNASTGSVLARYDYTLGPVGNRTRIAESSGRTVDYSYDNLLRLTQEVDTTGGTTTTTRYTYDAVGNRLSMDQNGAVTSYTYNAKNQLLTAGAARFAYDRNGNLARREEGAAVTQYSYNAKNQLTRQVAADGQVSTFAYDPAGNRVERDVAGTLTRFVVDPLDNSGVAQVLAELDGSGAVAASYVYGDDLISMRQGSSDHFYHYDGTGSTRLLTDAAGSISDTYAYDAFGNLSAATGNTPNVYRFAGEQLDPNLGFYYLRARYMSPELGRFVSSDPYAGSTYDPPSLHKYMYAHNDPINKIDPTGMFSIVSVSITISINSTLASILGGLYLAYKDIKGVVDQIKTLLVEIPGLNLNESAKADELRGLRVPQLKVGLGGVSVELPTNLGGGAVDKSYEIVKELVKGTWGEALVSIWSHSAGTWMAELPEVNGIPGHYKSCEFNRYVFQTYQLQLVSGLAAAKAYQPALQVIGAYLAYFNFIALASSTVDDLTYNQPPSQSCSMFG